MAPHHVSINIIGLFSFLLLMIVVISSAASSEDDQYAYGESSCYTSIISFGDSYSDTGNSLFAFDLKTLDPAHPPYGETFFRRPTGRYCDGRLVLDFIAQALGFPLLPPSLARLEPSIYRKGINFAVGGATALNSSFFAERSISILTNFSLSVQMDWFNHILPDLCSTTHHYQGSCRELLKDSLVVVGGFGGNDYLRASLAGKTTQEILTYVPLVLKAISNAITNLIEKGAVDVLVQGFTSGGCLPIALTLSASTNASDYDEFGCLKTTNEFDMFHNSQLQTTLQNLRDAYPHARIMYADFYNASKSFYKYPSLFGFNNTLSACCGEGGLYNYNYNVSCGESGIKACKDPSSYVNWDGIHLTEKSYEWIAIGVLNGFFTHPSINIPTKCFHSIPSSHFHHFTTKLISQIQDI